jgi:hypothetical protein
LAVIDRLLEVIGDDIALAYDVGCALHKTVMKSSLRARVEKHRLHLMTGAFHGHAHNRACQLDYHPLYIPGTGKSDGEGCEHCFCFSNALVPGTRHATPFHRLQAILEHFNFWDDDKYAALSEMIPWAGLDGANTNIYVNRSVLM